MKQLNLPTYQFKLKEQAGKKYIFDEIRKKYLVLNPEEWVRQNFVRYLVTEKKYPKSLINIEKAMKLNNMVKRADIVCFDNFGRPNLIVECKAPSVKINQSVFNQIARYNMVLKVKYLVVTNGLQHYSCLINHANKSYSFLEEIPAYE